MMALKFSIPTPKVAPAASAMIEKVRMKKLANCSALYNHYAIVAEQNFAFTCVECDDAYYNNSASINTRIGNRAWNFRVTNYGGFATRKLSISIQLEEQHHNIGEPAIAEVIFWQWAINSNDNDGRTILERIQFNESVNKERQIFVKELPDGQMNVLVRLLQEKSPHVMNEKKHVISKIPPIHGPEDELLFSVEKMEFSVSKHYLAQHSPLLKKMLFMDEEKVKEEKRVSIELEGVKMEHFADFLDCISPIKPVTPNPANVMEILKLADYFQIEHLRKLCEEHLCTCVEHPMLELLYWSDIYGLDNVVDSLLHLNKDEYGYGRGLNNNIREFSEKNRTILFAMITNERTKAKIQKILKEED